MRWSVWALGALCWAAPAAADDAVTVPDDLQFAGDGQGHYLAYGPATDASQQPFYGDGKDFWQLQIAISSTRKGQFEAAFWDGRYSSFPDRQVSLAAGKVMIRCGKRTTDLVPLADAERQTMLEQARFHKPRWDRRPYVLARDDGGVYYFVDRVLGSAESSDFRLYIGRSGKLKLTKLKNIVKDAAGDIFSTKTGDLRLVLGENQATWVRGRRKTSLTVVPLEKSSNLIYNELGVYARVPLGTPCDDL